MEGLQKTPMIFPSGVFHGCTHPFNQNLSFGSVKAFLNDTGVQHNFKFRKDFICIKDGRQALGGRGDRADVFL